MNTTSVAVDSSLTVKRDTTATRKQVWDVIADGWTYSQWVVGNTRMRAVDPNWPAPGSVIHHTIGIWPMALNDETVVDPARRVRNWCCWPRPGPLDWHELLCGSVTPLRDRASRWRRFR